MKLFALILFVVVLLSVIGLDIILYYGFEISKRTI